MQLMLELGTLRETMEYYERLVEAFARVMAPDIFSEFELCSNFRLETVRGEGTQA